MHGEGKGSILIRSQTMRREKWTTITVGIFEFRGCKKAVFFALEANN